MLSAESFSIWDTMRESADDVLNRVKEGIPSIPGDTWPTPGAQDPWQIDQTPSTKTPEYPGSRPPPTLPPAPAQLVEKKSEWWKWALALGGGALVIGGAFYLFGGKKKRR